jgi:hypothetical protein
MTDDRIAVMVVPRHIRFVRAIALLAAAPLLEGNDAGTPRDPRNPYLNPGCASTQPSEGSACSATFSCSYGAGMCGPQCDCVQHRWHCHTVCVGPLAPPECCAVV